MLPSFIVSVFPSAIMRVPPATSGGGVLRYSNISAEEKNIGTLQNHYDSISAMDVLSRLRASATMGQQSPRTTSSDDVTLPTYDRRDVFRQNLSQKSEGGVQDSMSLDLPCAQRVDPTGRSPPAAEAADGASAPTARSLHL